MMEEQAPAARPDGILTLGGSRVVLPRVIVSIGDDGFSTSRLLVEGKIITLDPGYTNVASCESTITFIDDDKGILRCRSYPVEQLAKNSGFLEVAYLLTYGEFPDVATLESFIRSIRRHRLLHEDFKAFLTAFPYRGCPTATLQAGVTGLTTHYEDTLDPRDSRQLDTVSVLPLAKVPTMISYIAKRAVGLSLLCPDSTHGYTEDLTRMTLGMPY